MLEKRVGDVKIHYITLHCFGVPCMGWAHKADADEGKEDEEEDVQRLKRCSVPFRHDLSRCASERASKSLQRTKQASKQARQCGISCRTLG